MRVWKKTTKYILLSLLFTVVVIFGTAVARDDSSQTLYSVLEKAFYLSDNAATFLRPGFHIQITGVTIGTDRTATVTFRLTDDGGNGLDRLGKDTPGPVSVSFILAYIPKGKTQYVDYSVRPQTSPITGVTANQAGTDSGGT